MSMIRLSVLEDGIYAPDGNGTIDPAAQKRFAQPRGRLGKGRMPLVEDDTVAPRSHPLERYLARGLELEGAALPDSHEEAPLVILVHGWQFDPTRAHFSPPHHRKAANPHSRLFHFERHPQDVEMRAHSTSWPLGLGLAQGDRGAAGLAIGFAWDSAPGLFEALFETGLNPYAAAYAFADDVVAWQLVSLIDRIAQLRPGRKVDLFCHSLGSRVVVRALAKAAKRRPDEDAVEAVGRRVVEAVDRVILLAGAEYVLEAQLMMARLNRTDTGEPGGARAHRTIPSFYNIVSRENDVLDKLGENFGPNPEARGSRQVIGHNGLEGTDPAWIDLQLDDPDVAEWFRGRGFQVSGDEQSAIFAVLDHWIHYTWRENMRVYDAILRDRDRWAIDRIKDEAPELFRRRRLIRSRGRVLDEAHLVSLMRRSIEEGRAP